MRSGSPPRVRGKRIAQKFEKEDLGIIPARAGKTWRRIQTGARSRDHPRACGENFMPYHAPYFVKGSPPRVRGKPGGRRGCDLTQGITPARAGKTLLPLLLFGSSQDHPRACGENLLFDSGIRFSGGSPPRVRGKRQELFQSAAGRRITPARAGKTTA